MAKEKKVTQKDLDRLEKRFKRIRDREMEFYMEYLKHPWKLFLRSFFIGIVKGIGFFIGSTVVIATILYISGQVLGNIPEIGEFFSNLTNYLDQAQP